MTNKCVYTFISTFLFLVFIIGFLFSCNKEPEASNPIDENTLVFNMKWNSKGSLTQEKHHFNGDVCEDFGIENIALKLYDASGSLFTQQNWPCSMHHGIINGIPAGQGYNVYIEALVNSKPDWVAEVFNLVVYEGKTVVDAVMEYKGEDRTPPSIETVFPENSSQNVKIDAAVNVTFSEKLAHSSVAANGISLYEGDRLVESELSHNAMSPNVILKPQKYLKYDTTYTLNISAEIRDCANNKMMESLSFSFSTAKNESTPMPPDSPSGFKADARENRVILSWDPVKSADSYMIYMGETQGVTKNPSQYQTVEVNDSYYEWPSLQNEKIYYFIITSIKGGIESDASVEVSGKPILIPFQENLILYYDFIDGKAVDLSGKNSDGTVFNTSPVKDKLGRENRAISFNGLNSYVEVSPFSHFTPLHYTIVAVVNVNHIKRNQLILQKGSASPSFSLSITSNKTTNYSYPTYSHFEAKGFSSANYNYQLVDGALFPIQEFVHIALTLKSLQNEKKGYTLKSYINGEHQKTYNALPELLSSVSSLFIGMNGNKKSDTFFEGTMDDLIIYNRVLVSEEIRSLYEFSDVDKQYFYLENFLDNDSF